MSVIDRDTTEAIDAAMMARCIELSRTAKQVGEFPFACVIARGEEVIVETLNRVARDEDVTRHAEIVAVSMAQKKLGTKDLTGCTLYTNVEPCAMCSFPIRETHISRVVYAIGSRLMGGDSKWDVLGDPELSKVMPEAFSEAPEVKRGFMRRDAEKAWRAWNPLIWGVIRYRGCFGEPPKAEPVTPAVPRRRSILQKLFAPHG
jgi:tRNA(adenine34) deaminase